MNESVKQRIIELNKRLGLNTEFITDDSILGYALNNTIYINTSIDQDYERTNKHEVLHFYEGTDKFQEMKTKILGDIDEEKLDKIKKEYELRYYGIYSPEEIEKGILDTEIAIDILVDNTEIEYENGLKLGEELLGNIEAELAERRYLNLSLNNNINAMKISTWEKIFVANYYDGKKRILPQKERERGIKEDIGKYLQELYELGEEEFKINPGSPAIEREYQSEIKALKQRGEDTRYLEANKENSLQELAGKYSKQLHEEYKHIVDMIKGESYEDAFKALMLRETLTKTYKLDQSNESKKTIVKNRDMHGSIEGHMTLNKDTLGFIYKNIGDMENYKNFANLYFAALEVYKKTIAKESGITLDGVETYNKGRWIKFEGKGTDENKYLENAEKLAALVKDTPWCTKTLASSQLAEGDFYVFVDKEDKPHIAVRMSGDQIEEVRGIQNGNAQELEENYRDVALSFLENNKEIKNGKEWLEKEEWNKRLIEYKNKIESGTLKKEEVPQLMEDICKSDYRSHGGENTNKAELKKVIEKAVPVIAEYYECDESEIYVGDIKFSKTDFEVNPYRIILGNADFSNSKVTNLGELQSIGGDADFSDSKVMNLGNLQSIGGDANFDDSQVTNLGKLQSIGGDAWFSASQVTNLGKLQSIGGYADFRNSQVKNLGKLQIIRGGAWFGCSQITNLGKLQSIGGFAAFSDSKVESLGKLQSIGGYADFRNSKVADLGKLQSIVGDAYFRNSQVTNLGELQSIGGYANFSNSKVADLGELQSIGGHANFINSKVADLGELQSIGGKIYYDDEKSGYDFDTFKEKFNQDHPKKIEIAKIAEVSEKVNPKAKRIITQYLIDSSKNKLEQENLNNKDIGED